MTVSNGQSYQGLKYTVNAGDIAALGAATSGDITLFTLPPGSIIQYVTVKPVVAVAGTSFSAATARVITAAHNYGTAFDVFQAVGATVYDFDDEGQSESMTASVPVLLHMTSTGGNLSATTAGTIDVWVTYKVRGS